MKTFAMMGAAGLLLIPAVVPAGPARSQPLPDVPSTRVAYGDLNLGATDGAHALVKRLNRAASEVCGDLERESTHDMQAVMRYQACRHAAIGRAVNTLDAPLVTNAFRPYIVQPLTKPILQAQR
ncbi:MAG: UrcA family protein [Phenylobacterium sp.]